MRFTGASTRGCNCGSCHWMGAHLRPRRCKNPRLDTQACAALCVVSAANAAAGIAIPILIQLQRYSWGCQMQAHSNVGTTSVTTARQYCGILCAGHVVVAVILAYLGLQLQGITVQAIAHSVGAERRVPLRWLLFVWLLGRSAADAPL